MQVDTKRLIRVRSERRARFKRDGYGTKKQLSASWRRPRGLQSKQRAQKKAKGAHPMAGYGAPVAIRGLHPSGYQDILIFTPSELTGLDPETQAIRIGGTVGNKKREVIQDLARAAGLKILNPKDASLVVKGKPEEVKADE